MDPASAANALQEMNGKACGDRFPISVNFREPRDQSVFHVPTIQGRNLKPRVEPKNGTWVGGAKSSIYVLYSSGNQPPRQDAGRAGRDTMGVPEADKTQRNHEDAEQTAREKEDTGPTTREGKTAELAEKKVRLEQARLRREAAAKAHNAASAARIAAEEEDRADGM